MYMPTITAAVSINNQVKTPKSCHDVTNDVANHTPHRHCAIALRGSPSYAREAQE